MKKISILIIVLLTLLITTSCELFMQEPTAGKVYAIFVALDYQNTNKLGTLLGTINDARAQALAFKEVSGTSNYEGFLFLQEGVGIGSAQTNNIKGVEIEAYPSVQNLKDAINALAPHTTKDDLFIFTYSGHATEGFITLGPEFVNAKVEYDAADLLNLFEEIKGRKLIILDACETGLAIPYSQESSSTLLENSISKWYAKYFAQTPEHDRSLYVMSSSANTDSYEITINGKKYGAFTQALLQGLGWDHKSSSMSTSTPPAAKNGKLTTDGLLRYIKKHQIHLLKRSWSDPKKYFQHPMVTGGARDMVIFAF